MSLIEVRHGALIKSTTNVYRVNHPLGEGAYGRVYQADVLGPSAGIPRDVAIKILEPGIMPGYLEREAETAVKLKHPRILPTYDYGMQEGYPFIVMMHARHGSLADALKKGKPLSPEEIAQYLISASAAANYANHRGVSHQDLKPSNLVLDSDEGSTEKRLYVSDWGSSQLHNSVIYPYPLEATPAYAAPEQLDNPYAKVSSLSDLYSLGGVVAFELLTGRRPFYGSLRELIVAHKYEIPPSFRSIIGEDKSREAFEPVVRKALAKDPRDRQKDLGVYANEIKLTAAEIKKDVEKDAVVIDLYTAPRPVEPRVTDPDDALTHVLETPAEPDEATALARFTVTQQRPQQPLTVVQRGVETRPAIHPLIAEEANGLITGYAKDIFHNNFLGVESIAKLEATLSTIAKKVTFGLDRSIFMDFPYYQDEITAARNRHDMLILRPDTVNSRYITIDELVRLFDQPPFTVIDKAATLSSPYALKSGYTIVSRSPYSMLLDRMRPRTPVESVWDRVMAAQNGRSGYPFEIELTGLVVSPDDKTWYASTVETKWDDDGNALIIHDLHEIPEKRKREYRRECRGIKEIYAKEKLLIDCAEGGKYYPSMNPLRIH